MRGLAGEINPQQRDMLGRVDKRLDGLLELINDLLSLAASKTFDSEAPLEVLAVQPVIKQLIDQYSVQAEEKNIKLVFLTPEQDLDVRASEDGMQKIFAT